jgi:hypothetical protein
MNFGTSPDDYRISGLMTQTEYQIFESRVLPVSKNWMPIQWALNLMVLAREQNKISADQILWNSQEASIY